uniref:Uncharacterized protein n=1 Tax=Wuchereria bancrofti TaxID=6293 RepID=A0A1I8EPN4_WUCBA
MHWCRNGSTSVTHGPSVDALTRQLCGGAPRTPNDFMCRLQQIPYLACLKQWNNPSVVIVMLLTVVVITVINYGNLMVHRYLHSCMLPILHLI